MKQNNITGTFPAYLNISSSDSRYRFPNASSAEFALFPVMGDKFFGIADNIENEGVGNGRITAVAAPETGERHFNADTLVAFEEGDAMLDGRAPAKRFASIKEMLADLDSDD